MKKAYTLVEVMIIMVIISMIVAIAIPGFVRARRVSHARACQANLQRINGAIANWVMENGQSADNVSIELLMESSFGDDVEPYLRREWPSCPGTGQPYALDDGNAVCPSGLLGHRREDIGLPISEWSSE